MNDVRPLGRRRTRPTTAPSADSGRARGRTLVRHPYSTSYDIESAGYSQLAMLEATARPSTSAGVTSKIMSSVKRSLSYSAPGKRREAAMSAAGMYSTPEESLAPSSTRSDFFDRPALSPTIEQIAMGLHISRTPHLGSSKAYSPRMRHRDTPDVTPQTVSSPSQPSRPTHRRRDSAPPLVSQLPPPPARSSLKKPPTPFGPSRSPSTSLMQTDSFASLSTLTSTGGPSTPRSNRSDSTPRSMKSGSFASKLSYSMTRLLLPMRRSSSPSVTTLSTNSSDSASAELTPRKVVRFTAISGVADEESV